MSDWFFYTHMGMIVVGTPLMVAIFLVQGIERHKAMMAQIEWTKAELGLD